MACRHLSRRCAWHRQAQVEGRRAGWRRLRYPACSTPFAWQCCACCSTLYARLLQRLAYVSTFYTLRLQASWSLFLRSHTLQWLPRILLPSSRFSRLLSCAGLPPSLPRALRLTCSRPPHPHRSTGCRAFLRPGRRARCVQSFCNTIKTLLTLPRSRTPHHSLPPCARDPLEAVDYRGLRSDVGA